MAFIPEGGDSRENPLQFIKGVKRATIKGFTITENKFFGQLFRPNEPESENNRPNPYKTQYEIDLVIHTPYTDENDERHEEMEVKVWANPTVGERAKLREIAEAAGAWVEVNGKHGLDDELLPDSQVDVHVKDGKIAAWLPVEEDD